MSTETRTSPKIARKPQARSLYLHDAILRVAAAYDRQWFGPVDEMTFTGEGHAVFRKSKGRKTVSKTTQPETEQSLNDALNEARIETQRITGALSRMGGAHASDAKGVHALGMQRARLNAELADAHRREGAAEIASLEFAHTVAFSRGAEIEAKLAEAEAALAEGTRAAEAAKQARDTAERRVLALRVEQGRRQMHMREMEARLGVLGAPPSRTTPWPEAGRQPVAVAPARR